MICNLEEILLPSILPPTKKLINHKTKSLNGGPSENFGSTIMALEITLQNNETDETEIINCVVKRVTHNEFILAHFNPSITFSREFKMYTSIVPTINEFEREHNQNCFNFIPKFYGGHLGDSSEAILILENLKSKGFRILEQQTIGFDLECSKVILKDLAKFHAVPLALKLKKSEVFNSTIKSIFTPFRPYLAMLNSFNKPIEEFVSLVDGNLAKRYETALNFAVDKLIQPDEPCEPFATLTHNDFWVNNILMKFENGKLVQNKIVDYQFVDYSSPAVDLLVFLYISVRNDVVENSYDVLVNEYFDEFIQTLKIFNVDISEFTMEAFENEIEWSLKNIVLIKLAFMAQVIHANHNVVEELDDFTKGPIQLMLTQECKEKLLFCIKEFAKREWI